MLYSLYVKKYKLIRLINLKRNLFDLAGKKTPTGQTGLKKRVVSSKSNFNYFPHPDKH